MLNIENISKTYQNGVVALNQLSLQVEVGMFGLLGPNGAGKSTLMRTIATLQQPDSGHIFLDNIDVINDQTKLRSVLGYLPQEFGVHPNVSAEKLLDYFARLKGIHLKSDRNAIINYALEVTNLSEHRSSHVSTYSGGMKRRFGIAQILLNGPRLIIVDEPTAGLDPSERNRFLGLLRELSSDNIVVFSTHIVDDIGELCQDLAIVNQGRIHLQGAPGALISRLKGQIWEAQIPQSDLEQTRQRCTIISEISNTQKSVSVRVLSDDQPGPGFKMVSPSLEDVYFATLHRRPTDQISKLSAS